MSFKSIKSAFLTALLLSGGLLPLQTVNAQALDINRILSATNAAASKDRNDNAARERRFTEERNKQRGRLNAMQNERANQERISDQLDAQFNVNEVQIVELQDELRKELGDLQELFGVIQQTASESQDNFRTSLISAQYPERAEGLRLMVEKMASQTQLVSIDEIEDLWFELQNELNEQSKVVKYYAPVTYLTGQEENENGELINTYATEERQVTRVGVFSAVSGNDIATYSDEGGLKLLDRQMDASFTGPSNSLQSASSGVTSFVLDPTKGSLLSALVTKPSIPEKVQEGKVIGMVIIALGLIALVIALWRILVLSGVEAKVKKQAKDLKRPSLRNPLGRVLKVYQDNPETDPESMELKLSEAILKESPKLNRLIMFIKIIAVVAPLLGLLGTVTGMIQTFQAITLFGAGDPQMMAGGISQALVTTVLGLVVAIPTVFLHWLASSRAKRVENILEEHAAGLIAEQYQSHA
ncbi:MAG: MotA/TolQ/ExbB proton channel family protein [Acidiferrobacterales bacterium]|nr:MotA/TolQ/ExbB proton channel family protein [Acidiferrobacterales bacterium]